MSRHYQAFKAVGDVGLAAMASLLLAPVLALLALVIRLDSRGPAIYRQKRIGRGGRTFEIWKFRSMKTGAPTLSTEEMQRQIESGIYNPYTRLGPLLRKTNLDELPQLWNILKGEMSFIGPRPALPSQTDVNELREKSGVHNLRPGITGLAQVSGRDDLDTQTKVSHDANYASALSLRADIGILIRTLGAVLSGRGNK